MKKSIVGTLVAGAMAMTIVLGGCGAQQQAAPAPEEPAVKEQTTETTTQETKKDEPAVTEEQTTVSASTPTEQQAPQISEDEAKRIALDDAGVAEQDATLFGIELDSDDGVTKYEVSFNVGQTEYEYDIDAMTGAILESSSEIDD